MSLCFYAILIRFCHWAEFKSNLFLEVFPILIFWQFTFKWLTLAKPCTMFTEMCTSRCLFYIRRIPNHKDLWSNVKLHMRTNKIKMITEEAMEMEQMYGLRLLFQNASILHCATSQQICNLYKMEQSSLLKWVVSPIANLHIGSIHYLCDTGNRQIWDRSWMRVAIWLSYVKRGGLCHFQMDLRGRPFFIQKNLQCHVNNKHHWTGENIFFLKCNLVKIMTKLGAFNRIFF